MSHKVLFIRILSVSLCTLFLLSSEGRADFAQRGTDMQEAAYAATLKQLIEQAQINHDRQIKGGP